ncbi:hypothetical protein NKJ33_25980 [Mesorhizobium sp. M0155]
MEDTDCAVTVLSARRTFWENSDDETVDQHAVSPCKKAGFVPEPLLGTAGADLIMAWLQPQATRERPGHLCNWNRHLRCREPLHDGAAHKFFDGSSRSAKASASGIWSAKQLLQLGVLVFQSLQPLGVRDVHPAMLSGMVRPITAALIWPTQQNGG